MSRAAPTPWARAGRATILGSWRPSPADAGLVALLIVISAFLIHQSRGTIFFYDEWSVWAGRYGADPEKWLGPINGHLCAVPILIFTTLSKVFGAETHLPFRIAVVVFHAISTTLLYVVARRRLDGPLALAAVAPLSVIAGGWLVLLMPFAGLFAIGPLIAATGAYLCLERGGWPGDVGACLLLFFGLACSASGIAVLVGAGAYLLWRRPWQWRRLWIVALPAASYVAWRLGYGVESEFSFADLGLVLSYVVRGLASGLGAYTTLGDDYARVLAIGLLAVVLAETWRRRAPGRALAAFGAIAVSYWALIAIARGPELGPEEVRYVYFNAALAGLIVLALVPAVGRASTAQVVAAGVLATLTLLAQITSYRAQAANYRQTTTLSNADLFAINATRDTVAEGLIIPAGDPQLSAGPYLVARRFWGGPPGFSEAEVRAATPAVRNHVDTTLVAALGLTVAPLGSFEAVHLAPLDREALQGDVEASGARCWALPGGGAPVEVHIASRSVGGIVVSARDQPVEILIGRYSDTPAHALGTVAASSSAMVAIPADRARAAWWLRLTAKGAARLCGLAR